MTDRTLDDIKHAMHALAIQSSPYTAKNLRVGWQHQNRTLARINKKSMRELKVSWGLDVQWWQKCIFQGTNWYCSNDMIACVNASLSRRRHTPTVSAEDGNNVQGTGGEKSSGTPCSYNRVVHTIFGKQWRRKKALAAVALHATTLRDFGGQQKKSQQSSSVFGSAGNGLQQA